MSLDNQTREKIWNFIKDNEKTNDSKSINIIHRVSENFGDEYLMITIKKPEQVGYYKNIHVTLWKKPWVKHGAFHFVSGLDRAPEPMKDTYGFFKHWYQVFDNNKEVSIRKYTGKDVTIKDVPPKNPDDEKYIKYKNGLEMIKERYFVVIIHLVNKVWEPK